jgi:hypothetical protein
VRRGETRHDRRGLSCVVLLAHRRRLRPPRRHIVGDEGEGVGALGRTEDVDADDALVVGGHRSEQAHQFGIFRLRSILGDVEGQDGLGTDPIREGARFGDQDGLQRLHLAVDLQQVEVDRHQRHDQEHHAAEQRGHAHVEATPERDRLDACPEWLGSAPAIGWLNTGVVLRAVSDEARGFDQDDSTRTFEWAGRAPEGAGVAPGTRLRSKDSL